MFRSILKISVLTGALLTGTLQSATASDQYVVIQPVTSSNGLSLSGGTRVQVLGVNDVPSSVASSGKLLTFLSNNEIHTADASAFKEQLMEANLSLTPPSFKTAQNGDAQLCTTLFHSDTDARVVPVTQDLAQYIRVTKDGQRVEATFKKPTAVLRSDATSYRNYSRHQTDVCIQGLEYGANYSVTFLPGLDVKACSDQSCSPIELDRELTTWAKTGDKTPSIGLSNGQTVLPAEQAAYVPISVTNIDEVEVSLYKVDLRSLNASRYTFKSLDGYDINNFERNVGLKVGTFKVPLSLAKNQSEKINIDLSSMIPAKEPGLYVAVFESEAMSLSRYDARPTQWLIRSNISVSTYHGQSETRILLSEFDSVQSIPNASLQIIAGNNRVLFDGLSDDNGSLSIPSSMLAGEGDHAPRYLIAQRGDNEVAIMEFSAEGSKLSVGQDGQLKSERRDLYLTTDRELYRAGETIQFLSLARDIELNVLADHDFKVELRDPESKLVHNEVMTSDSFGVLSGSIELKDNARLGEYQLRVLGTDEVLLSSHTIELQDYVPLTIEASIKTPQLWSLTGQKRFELLAEYFSGGAATGLKAEVYASLKRVNTHENSELQDYRFGNHSESLLQSLASFETNGLDSEGRFTKEISLAEDGLIGDGLYSVQLKGTVFDVGGRPNSSIVTVPVDTKRAYIGAKTLFDGALSDGASPSFKLINISRLGETLPLTEYQYELQRVYYDFNWYYDDGWRYRRTRLESEILTTGSSNNETLTLEANIGWGSYELVVTSDEGFKTVVPFWAGWYGDKPITEPTQLAMSAEKIGTGELRIRVDAPFAGTLRLMEATSDIKSISSHEIIKGQNEIVIPTTVDSEPGFHVLGTLLRPIARGEEHLPQVAIGSHWISQLKDQRLVKTTFNLAETQRSTESTEVSVSVDVEEGKARIFLVDEGIHAITGYENVNPVNFFYGPRKLNLGFLSNFGSLITQDDSLKAFGVGGDQASGSAAVAKSEFFKTVTDSSPLLDVVDGKVQYTFDAPNFEGRLRAVVWVAGKEGIGFAHSDIRVQDKISVDSSLPRFVGAGDKISGKLALRFNDDVSKVTLKQRVGDQVTETTLSGAKGGQPIAQSISLNTLQSGRIPVDLGLTYEDTNVLRDFSLVVREPSYPMSQIQSIAMEKGVFSSETAVSGLDFSAFGNTKGAEVNWSVSPLPGASMSSVTQALNRYPYGCIEQTSSGTRGLFATASLNGASADVIDKIESGVEKILAKQKSNGAFGYWDRNDRIEQEYLPYAADTLIQARDYISDTQALDAGIQKALDYLDRQFFEDAWTSIYANGLLAQAGYEVTSRARYAIDEQLPKALKQASSDMSDQLDLIAAGYWLAIQIKDTKRAVRLSDQFESLYDKAQSTSYNDWFANVSGWFKQHSSNDDFSKLRYWRARAGVLVGSLTQEQRTPAIDQYIDAAIQKHAKRSYRSTLDNANFAALLLGAQTAMSELDVRIDGRSVPVASDYSISIDREKATRGFTVEHNGSSTLYLNADITGRRVTTTAVDNGFEVQKLWINEAGEIISVNKEPINVKQGDVYSVMIVVSATSAHGNGNLMLTDLLPSGFEIEANPASAPFFYDKDKRKIMLSEYSGREPVWSESMDDRYVANFDNYWYEKDHVITHYQVRAVYPGEMVIPDAHVELMYRPEINGRSTSTTGSITE
jgi:uncharacterized protein YfaS (alpha-2-macroglobulin family)